MFWRRRRPFQEDDRNDRMDIVSDWCNTRFLRSERNHIHGNFTDRETDEQQKVMLTPAPAAGIPPRSLDVSKHE